jgi:hypothetical protein
MNDNTDTDTATDSNTDTVTKRDTETFSDSALSIVNENQLARVSNQARREVANRTGEITKLLSSLPAITDTSSYQKADELLYKIRALRRYVEVELVNPIKKPLNELKNGVMMLEHFLDDPLDNLQKTVAGRMAVWQTEQKRIREEAERKQREERARLARIEEEARLKLQQEKDAKRREELERQAQEAKAARKDLKVTSPVPAQAKAIGSRVTTIRTWEVNDLEKFVAGVIKGEIPAITLAVNEDVMEAYWKQDAGVVSSWPGVKVKEETKVSGR